MNLIYQISSYDFHLFQNNRTITYSLDVWLRERVPQLDWGFYKSSEFGCEWDGFSIFGQRADVPEAIMPPSYDYSTAEGKRQHVVISLKLSAKHLVKRCTCVLRWAFN